MAVLVSFSVLDVGLVLTFNVRQGGAIYNLTGATVTLLAMQTGGATLSFVCTLNDPVNGVATYTVKANDFEAGRYAAQIQVVNGAVTLVGRTFQIVAFAPFA